MREAADRAHVGSTIKGTHDPAIVYRVAPRVTPQELNDLFAASWPGHHHRDWDSVLRHSLLYLCAYRDRDLVGFVNVAWDGGVHGFVLDTTVHPEMRRRGIGRQLVIRAASEAKERNLEWLHVDFEPQLKSFYAASGFSATSAGLMYLGAR